MSLCCKFSGWVLFAGGVVGGEGRRTDLRKIHEDLLVYG